MAKALSNVVGVDIGSHTLKAVHVIRKGNRYVLSGYSIRNVGEGQMESEEMGHHLKLLLNETRSGSKSHAVSSSCKDSVLRIITQPPTPVPMLRQALRLNGPMVLHQENLKDYIFDCDHIIRPEQLGKPANNQEKYLIAGTPRSHVERIISLFSGIRSPLHSLTLPGISLFNAFEVCRAEAFASGPFILLDIGNERSLVVGGAMGSLTMIRVIEYGGKHLMSDLSMGGEAVDVEGAQMLLEQGDAGMAELVRTSVETIAREALSSIGFLEGQLDRSVEKLYLSGAATRAELVSQMISDEVNLQVEVWDMLDVCQLDVSKKARAGLRLAGRCLNVAFGAAVGAMQPEKTADITK